MANCQRHGYTCDMLISTNRGCVALAEIPNIRKVQRDRPAKTPSRRGSGTIWSARQLS
jgi:hypothetical protein